MKRLIYEIYDCLRQYLDYNTQPPIIQYVLIYTHQAIRLIPDDQMDSSTRRIGACISYETTKDMLYKLPNLQNRYFLRLISSESLMSLRKWRKYSKIVTKFGEISPEDVALQDEQIEMISKGKDICKRFEML